MKGVFLLSGVATLWMTVLSGSLQAQIPDSLTLPPPAPGVEGGGGTPSGQTERSICLVSPQGSQPAEAIFSTRPVFVWERQSVSRIELFNVTEGRQVWSGRPELPVPQISYHSTPLIPGHQYEWTVYPVRSNLKPTTATFMLMGGAQRATIQAELDQLKATLTAQGVPATEINVAITDYFARRGLWADAITVAINSLPPSPILGRYVRESRDLICPPMP